MKVNNKLSKLIKYYNLINHNLIFSENAINRCKKRDFKNETKNLTQQLNNLEKSISEIKNCSLKDYVKIIRKAWNEIRRQKSSISLDYKKMYMTDFLQYLIDKGNKIKPSFISSGWLEFDTKDDINIYNKLLTKDKLQELFKIKDV